MDAVLQRILSSSKEYLHRIPPSKHPICQANEELHAISLPEPPSLLSALVNLGAPTILAEEMQCAYQKRANELKQQYEATVVQTTLALSQYPRPITCPSFVPKLLATVKELYTKKLEEWLRDGLSLYEKHASVNPGQKKSHNRGRGGTHTAFNLVSCLLCVFPTRQ